ncbi:hypothetical protein EZE58_09570 [Brevibacterium sp. LS14]|uniref:hypothetical protein n=1 Tax=Brevibacterium sp. LS14 TaxID=2528962 RepID=UPI0014311C5E|nr:hypothetical protein [Brevibacterium sp. LS14]
MPTFYDPVADAEEASQALRGLAHASRDFTHPEDAYGVIGDLLAGVRSMQQSIQQLATRHARHDGRAFDDAGDPAAGIRDARLAAGELSEAAAALDRVEEGLNRALQAAGRIAWHPAPPAPAETEMTRVQGPVSRWVNIVFLQSGEADAVLWLIDCDGPDAAIEHLAGFDYGEETTDAAMLNGYVYDTPPTGALDKEARTGEYTLTYNPDLGHVALYRHHQIAPEDSLDTDTPAPTMDPDMGSAGGAASAGTAMGAAGAAAAALSDRGVRATGREAGSAAGRGPVSEGSWFEHPGVAAVKRDRGLGL